MFDREEVIRRTIVDTERYVRSVMDFLRAVMLAEGFTPAEIRNHAYFLVEGARVVVNNLLSLQRRTDVGSPEFKRATYTFHNYTFAEFLREVRFLREQTK